MIVGATPDAVLIGVERDAPVGPDMPGFDADSAGVVLVDGAELTARWSAPLEDSRETSFATRSEDIVRAENRELARHDARTGEIVARAELPLRATGLAVQGDRALATLRGAKGAAVFAGLDLGEQLGAVVWRHELERAIRPQAALAAGRAYVSAWSRPSLDVFELASGTALPPIALEADERLARLHGGDAHGVLLAVWKGEHPALVERSLDGATLWRHDASFTSLAFGADAVLGVTHDESGVPGEVLLALDREKGRITWMQELGGRAPGVLPAHRVAVVADTVYVGTAGAKISVSAYELKTGAPIFERSFTLPVDMAPVSDGPLATPAAFDMVPLDERIVLVVGSEGETVVALLGP